MSAAPFTHHNLPTGSEPPSVQSGRAGGRVTPVSRRSSDRTDTVMGEDGPSANLSVAQFYSAGVRQIGRLAQLARRPPEQPRRRVRRASGREQLMLTRQGVRHRLVQNSLHQSGLLHGGNIAERAGSFTMQAEAFAQ